MSLDDYRKAVEKNITSVFLGWNIILDMTKDFREAAVLLITKDTLEIKKSFLKYLNAFIAMYPKVFIVSSIDMDELNALSNDKVVLMRVTESEMYNYLLYGSITQEPNIRIISMKVKNIRNADKLLNFKGIDTDTIVCRGIFGIVGEVDEC